LRRIPWDQVRSDGYSFLEELLWLLERQQARIREVPIVFVDRTQGSSKITTGEARAALWVIFRLALERLRRWVSPSKLLPQTAGEEKLNKRKQR
jgi:dolichol-phosphate mannosyltransferase